MMEPQEAAGSETLGIAKIEEAPVEKKATKKVEAKVEEPAEGYMVSTPTVEEYDPAKDPHSAIHDVPRGTSIVNTLPEDHPDYCAPEPRPVA